MSPIAITLIVLGVAILAFMSNRVAVGIVSLGVAISLGLTLVGILSLKAVCGWCLLSLAIITALFLLIHLKRPQACSP